MSLSQYYLAQRLSFLQNEANAILNGLVPVTTNSNLATVLTNGNSAGTSDINLSNNDILGTDNISLTTINGLPYIPAPITYIPTLTSAGGGAPTYALNIGQYTQIGKAVYFQFSITLNGLGTLPVTASTIQIPLPIGTNDGADASFTSTLWTGFNNAVLPQWNSAEGSCGVGADFLTLSFRLLPSSATYSELQTTQILSTFSFRMNGFYFLP